MISYKPFFKTMKKKKISSYALIDKKGFNRATYYRIKAGDNVNVSTIDELCTLLDCEVNEIIEHIKG